VRFGIDGVNLHQHTALFGGQLDADLLGDVSGNFILQGEDVFQIAFVAPCPQMVIFAGFDQLRTNAHTPRAARDRAFHDCIDLQIAPNLRQTFLGALESHR
jgi:hypothetical protein